MIALISFAYSEADFEGIESEWLREYKNCSKSQLQLYRNSPHLIQMSDFDSLRQLLDDVEHTCNRIERRSRILYSILSNEFSDTSIDASFFDNIIQDSIQYAVKPGGVIIDGDQVWYELYTSYQSLLTTIADSLSNVLDSTSTEYLIALYYAGYFERFFRLIREKEEFENSRISQVYAQRVRKLKFDYGLHISFSGGYWIPTGKLSRIGTHPYINMNFIGIRWWRLFADADFEHRFLKSRNPIEFMNDSGDTLSSRGNNLGVGHVMAVFGIEAFRKGFHQIDVSFGVGMDLFQATGSIFSSNPEDVFLGSVSLNPSISYKFHCGPNRNVTIGPEIRYSILRYQDDKNAITNLSGNAISIRFVIGLNSHAHTDDDMRRLRAL